MLVFLSVKSVIFLSVMDVSIPKNDEFLHRQVTLHTPTENRHYNKISIYSLTLRCYIGNYSAVYTDGLEHDHRYTLYS